MARPEHQRHVIAARPTPSLLRLSAGGRMMAAGAAATLLWVLVLATIR